MKVHIFNYTGLRNNQARPLLYNGVYCMNKKISLVFKIALCIALILGCLLLVKRFMGSQIVINRDHAAVITRIQQLNKLETSVFTIEKIIDAHTPGNGFQRLLFGDKILLIAHGRVVAGVDLSKLSADQVKISGQSISITLPPTEILNSDLDEAQTEVYDRSQGILSKGDKDLESQARLAAEEEIRKAACEGGILTDAADRAKQQLTTLLQAFQFTEIEIKAEAGQC